MIIYFADADPFKYVDVTIYRPAGMPSFLGTRTARFTNPLIAKLIADAPVVADRINLEGRLPVPTADEYEDIIRIREIVVLKYALAEEFPSARDCYELEEFQYNTPGTYYINPSGSRNASESFPAYCSEGKTYILRRGQYADSPYDFFYENKNKAAYERGFGDPMKEYWIGLSALNRLTSSRDYRLIIEMLDVDDNYKRVSYSQITVGGETDWTLDIDGYKSKDHWAVLDSMWTSDEQIFSTPDADLTGHARYSGGWYPSSGGFTNQLFGLNLNSREAPINDGIIFSSFGGFGNSLKEVNVYLYPKDTNDFSNQYQVPLAMRSPAIDQEYLTQYEYSCPEGMSFDGNPAPSTATFTCDWSTKTYQPTTSTMNSACVYTHCSKDPPTPLPGALVQLTDWDGKPVPINGKVSYICRDKSMTFFNTDLGSKVEIACKASNNWENLPAGMFCIGSPSYLQCPAPSASGYTFENDGNYYKFFPSGPLTTHSYAQTQCSGEGGRLAEFRNRMEYETIRKYYLAHALGGEFWIGIDHGGISPGCQR